MHTTSRSAHRLRPWKHRLRDAGTANAALIPALTPALTPPRSWLTRLVAGVSTVALTTAVATALMTAALTLTPASVQAAIGGLPTNTGHADSSPEWEHLRTKLFQDRPMETEHSLVQLFVPLRAAYGASVPVKVVSKLPQTPGLYVKRIYLLVDKNPSPLAAVFDLTPDIGQADIETRLRVDEYSHIRVVSELSNGQLNLDSRYVKVSGGCSAPPNREHPEDIGKTFFKLPDGAKLNQVTPVDVQVVHPNDTGMELNNVTVMYIPPHFVRHLKVTYADHLLFDAELDFSISENPAFRFNFIPRAPGLLRADVDDSHESHYVGTLAVDPTTP